MEAVSLLGLFVMGVAYGSSACLISCAPALMPLMIGRGEQMGGSWSVIGIFSAGRVAAYTIIAAIASLASIRLQQFLENREFTGPITGGVMILTAAWLLYRIYRPAPTRCTARSLISDQRVGRWGALGIFAVGMVLSLNLCAPLLSLMAVSASSHSVVRGALYGLMFGLGSVLVTLMLYGVILAPVTRELLHQFHRQKVWIQTFAALALLAVGVSVAAGKLSL